MMSHEQKKVQQAMNASLSGLQADPWLTQRVLAKGEEPMKKKISGFMMVIVIVITIGMATAVAAGMLYLRRGLDAELQITDEIRNVYQETELFDAPKLSMTQNGVTVKVDQCIVDTHAAYLAFRVIGYTTEPGEEPCFADTECTIDHEAFSWGARFSNGLVIAEDGRAIYPDGSIPEDYAKLSYLDENGELIYIISLHTYDFSLIGRIIRIELKDLGIWGDDAIAVPGEWTFEWELKGDAQVLNITDLSAPIGQTGSTLTDVRLSPIHIRMVMNVPRNPHPTEEDELLEPYLYGIKLKDGTSYLCICEGGTSGYIDGSSDVFQQQFILNRIIEPSHVESLLFTSPLDGYASVIEVKIQ